MKRFYLILFTLFLFSVISCSTKKEIRIGIQPYSGMDKHIVDTIARTLQSYYGYKVSILPVRTIPANAFVYLKSPRYRADSLLVDLRKNKPDSIDYILGLTHNDISTTKRNPDGEIKEPESKYLDWGIFGLGYRPGPSSVVSSFRLQHEDNRIFTDRLKKVCIHELGHNLGLPHCPDENCVMQDAAETSRTVDSVDFKLCPECYRMIHPKE